MPPDPISRDPDRLIQSPNVDDEVAYFRTLGFEVVRIAPADDPRHATLEGNGKKVEIVATPDELPTDPAPEHSTSYVFQPGPDGSVQSWHRGRAGMAYRDLIPGRLGGRVIASHIRIPRGGPVDDYVHWHDVGFQFIYVLAGRVRVVYQDQGEPFWMEPGDCVLQPPEIRHRVLECSDGLEVLEVAGPADHATFGDSELALPNGTSAGETYGAGQRFHLHRAAAGTDCGLDSASRGRVRVERIDGGSEPDRGPAAVTTFGFVLEGRLDVESEGGVATLARHGAFAGTAAAAVRVRASDAARWVRVLIGDGETTDA